MKLLVLSDLHFEFHRDGGQSFVNELQPHGVDVLVVAGDLSDAEGLYEALGLLCERFRKVVYVHGNHEFYKSDRANVREVTRYACSQYSNLHWLDNDAVEIDGKLFVGTPLWFSRAPSWAPKHYMNDFRLIRNFESWVYEENAKSKNFLRRSIQPCAIVVTHYLPASESIHPAYAGNSLNPFFLCDVSDIIRETKPALWIHGHTHTSMDYSLDSTRVVCNPFGYARHEENSAFHPEKVIEL